MYRNHRTYGNTYHGPECDTHAYAYTPSHQHAYTGAFSNASSHDYAYTHNYAYPHPNANAHPNFSTGAAYHNAYAPAHL